MIGSDAAGHEEAEYEAASQSGMKRAYFSLSHMFMIKNTTLSGLASLADSMSELMFLSVLIHQSGCCW